MLKTSGVILSFLSLGMISGLVSYTYFFVHDKTIFSYEAADDSVELSFDLPSIITDAELSFDATPDDSAESRLLPDLIPFPPQDLKITAEGTRLRFSTTYYNAGEGVLELNADPSKTPHDENVERDIVQTIYLENGEKEIVESGSFYWHASHQHYHFKDFVDYKVESLENFKYVSMGGSSLDPIPEDEGNVEKATFCVRDMSRISGVPNTAEDATFRICSRWRQGVSVGWGDTYFHNYPDQFLDITNFPKGTYRLSFQVNPRKRFIESSYDNNESSVTFKYDKEKRSITILESFPPEVPDIEHIYLEQDF